MIDGNVSFRDSVRSCSMENEKITHSKKNSDIGIAFDFNSAEQRNQESVPLRSRDKFASVKDNIRREGTF